MKLVTTDDLRDGLAYFKAFVTKDFAAAKVLEEHGDPVQMLAVVSTFLAGTLRTTLEDDPDAILNWIAQSLAAATAADDEHEEDPRG